MSELWQWDATRLAAAIASRELSSREVVESCLRRLDAVNPAINAIVEVHPEMALAEADRADQAVRDGAPLGPLHGVPITTKINVDHIGHANTNGVSAYANRVASSDNHAVANLRRAGAVFVGRTNSPCFAWRWFTDNDLHGRTHNPWGRSITPGGSSGGAAAAVAAGIGPLSHGTDLGGSIRYPAYACNVLGMRATHGRIPSWDESVGVERTALSQFFISAGAFARTPSDLRLAMRALVQHEPRDPWSVPVPWAREDLPTSRRVAVFRDLPGIDGRVEHAVSCAAVILEKAGFEVEDAQPPHFREVGELWLHLVAEARLGYLGLIEELGDDGARAAARGFAELAPQLDLAGYVQGLARRSQYMRAWSAFFARYPVLLLPVSLQPPLSDELDRQGTDAARRLLDIQAPLCAINVLGLPAVSVPVAKDDATPMGVQIVADRYNEELCLRIADALFAVTGAFTPIDPRP